MVEPKRKKLADLEEIAAVLAENSQSTNSRAELVYMERASRPSDYDGRDVAGKIILTSDRIAPVQRIGVKEKGALGVISYYSGAPGQLVDAVGWQRSLRSENENETLFGFSISTRLGDELKEMLRDEENIIVSVEIEAQTYPGRHEVVSAEIVGSDLKEEEFILTAHLFEGIAKQGANDNNSGCAAILEVGRTIVELVKEGKIDPPRRTIRFLWVPEYEGTIAFLENNPEIRKRLMGGINMDTVGLNLYQSNSPFHVYRPPYSLPGYINHVAENITEYAVSTNRVTIEGRPYGTILASSGSRQQFMCWVDEFDSASDNDVYNIRQLGVPMVYFNNYTDDFTHTNEDAPKNSDPTQLKRVGFLGTAISYLIASADAEDAVKILAESYHRLRSRLAESVRKAGNLVSLSNDENMAKIFVRGRNLIEQSFLVEIEGLESCRPLGASNRRFVEHIELQKEELRIELERSLNQLRLHYERLCSMRGVEPLVLGRSETETRLSQQIPVVTTHELWPSLRGLEEGLEIYDINHGAYEAFNFIDGKRSILDIAQAVDAEFIDAGGVTPEAVEAHFIALEKTGAIKIESKE
jgi:hypothetical protein